VSGIKPVIWIGTAKDDVAGFPDAVRRMVGYALFVAQQGRKHTDAKPLRGFGGAGVLEIIGDHDGDTYRAVYTVRLAGRIYVLHAFQKKAKSGIKTPRIEIDLIKARLTRAEQQHAAWLRQKGGMGGG